MCEPGTSLDLDPLIYSWDDKHVTPYPACLLKWSLTNFFAWAGFEPDPPNFSLPSSWNYKFEPPVWTIFIIFLMISNDLCLQKASKIRKIKHLVLSYYTVCFSAVPQLG
jgi:hypothetical protein